MIPTRATNRKDGDQDLAKWKLARSSANFSSVWVLHHLQRVAHVTGENFLLKRLEVLSVGTVLPFAPSWPRLPRLQAPVAREHRREDLELVAGHVHLVHLRREG